MRAVQALEGFKDALLKTRVKSYAVISYTEKKFTGT